MIKGLKIVSVLVSILMFILYGLPYISTLDKNIDKRDFLDNIELAFPISTNSEFALVYFGYVGCRTICSPILKEVSRALSELDESKNVQFYFVNISDYTDSTDEFLYSFDKSFIGIEMNKNERIRFMSELNSYSTSSLFDKQEFVHSGNLYLFKRNNEKKYLLQTIFDFRPYDSQLAVEKFKKETM